MRIQLLLLMLLTNICFAQQDAIAFKDLKQTFIVENNETLQSLFILRDKTSSLAVSLNNQQQVLDSMRISNPEKKYKVLLASTFQDQVGQLFWTTEKKNELLVQTINFATQSDSFKTEAFKLTRGSVLVEFSVADAYYFVTLDRKTVTIQFYKFSNDGSFKQIDVDMSQEKFLTSDFKNQNFADAIRIMRLIDVQPSSVFQFIDPKQTTALSSAAYYTKAYVNNNQLILTLDRNINVTDLLFFDLNDFSLQRKSIKKPVLTYYPNMDSNSFLLDDYLYQIKVNNDGFVLTVNDLDGNVINKLGTVRDEDISFAIGNIKQSNPGSSDFNREFDKTSQFMRKFQNLNGGLTVYNYGDSKILAIGAVGNERNSSGMTMIAVPASLGIAGAIVTSAVVTALDIWFFNPSLNNLDAYANRKVMFFNAALNQEMQPEQITLPDLALDQINAFLNDNKKQTSNYNLSFKNGVYYLGYYNNKQELYYWQAYQDN
ncbi:hypothetical protein K5I29_10165 [Flavobacterium agricola]|uniref:Uncharacterized protein n=1 Tax=Flavobacterium agricola TaxID=2870839 RepID=A0ABY6M1V5_9FLAO|nr:hypothetical protein [Flavobacterium agricola]UYW00863.1 hypothetical protein K5I29_10165 [Flavobacterium agricola]